MERSPPDIQKAVCDSCWRTVFSIQSFHIAWSAKDAPPRSKSAGFSYISPTWTEMQHSIDFMQCGWCSIVTQMIMDRYFWTAPPPNSRTFQVRIRFSQRSNIADVGGGDGGPSVHVDPATHLYLSIDDKPDYKYWVHSAEGDPAARCIPQREVLLDVNSPTAYNLVQRCIDRCSRHKFCPSPRCTPLPTRLIDCKDNPPRLFVNPQGIEDKYVALSYVWGCKDQPHCTKQQNLDSYIGKGIPYIPKTVMDAVMVTRTLGLRYLWVDAFCIIQDSKDDKAREIRQIRRIFHNAYLTIVAASADTVYDGFLHRRRPPESPATLLPFHCPEGVLGTMQLRLRQHAPANPVDERAWCLEEHMLSPRRLIYGSHTLQYECQAMHVNVNGAPNFVNPDNGIPSLPYHIFLRVSEIPLGSNLPKDNDMIWEKVLIAYTRRTVTWARDRLNALAGIVEQFKRVWPNSRYMAGLWEHHLPGCLLWSKYGTSQCHDRPALNLAPSWSWASTNGKVSTSYVDEVNEGIILNRNTIECNVVPAHPENPHGSVKGGSLVLDIILRSALWDPKSGVLSNVQDIPTDCVLWIPSDKDKIAGEIIPDTLETKTWSTCEVQLALMRNTGYSLQGLVLILASDQNASAEQNIIPTYRRIGYFYARTEDKPEVTAWLTFTLQRVEII
ncbi:heterokaryon incompatibility protein-domain-containing protein [Armillaria novae-zelandiae]|uniref:Heterokaryon incompatibility protein-domain-containing protein n=1 Tax=Armillaria novae-zelandiae TaxID=153914 RepID=A0AA39PEK8_9AGAR|nr:heterokaryon incompatibility protein-domain-containing protein [Armillaria novae-zelandiae]